MAWPFGPLPVLIEMWTGSAWVDITSLVRTSEGIVIRRGFPDEGRSPEPGSIAMTLDNRTGNLSPRNPAGTWYGTIGRNTPVRVTVGGDLAGEPYLDLRATYSSGAGSGAQTPDNAAIDITGDIDVRWDGALDGWAEGAVLTGKYATVGNQRSWAFSIDTSGRPVLTWSTDGTSGGELSATATTTAGLVSGERMALRATLDVNNGAGGWTATFYTADTIDGSWVQLGSPVPTAGVTNIFNSTTSMRVGGVAGFESVWRTGRVYAAQLRDGIGGTIVANPDFRDQFGGDRSFTDSAGRSWSLLSEFADVDATAIVDPGIRGLGEVSEWPSRWDVAEADIVVPTVAQGVLRRLRQGNRPSRSPLRSHVDLRIEPTSYWPMEDAAGTFFGSAVAAGSPMTYSGTVPEFHATGSFLGSDSVAVLGSTSRLSAPVAQTSSSTSFAVSCLLDVPAVPGWSDNTPILWVEMGSGAGMQYWEVRYKTGSGGGLEVRILDATGAAIDTTGTLAFAVEGEQVMLSLLALEVSPTNISVEIHTYRIDADGEVQDDSSSDNFTTSAGLTRPVAVAVAPTGGLDGLGVGHVHFTDFVFGQFSDSSLALLSFAGEYASHRAMRLLVEAGVTPAIVGSDPTYFNLDFVDQQDDGTVPMGAQEIPAKFVDAFNETYTADQALTYETRDVLGITWRTGDSLYNQDPAATLDYAGAGEVAPPLEPTDDDQNVVNDVEVKRKNGSSARAVDVTSRMSVLSPPDGVGRYETSVEINVPDDDVLANHAGWRLHVGTWDEQRYPTVHIDLAALAAAGKWDLIARAAQLDVGDRLVIENLPSWCPPGGADLMCLGFTETIGAFGWDIVINCVPYGPYNVGTYSSGSVTAADRPARYDGAFSTTSGSFVTGVDPSLTVVTSQPPLWTTDGLFPLDIVVRGCILTVSAISGSSSPQTFTITAAAPEGVTIPSGSEVHVRDRGYNAL